MVLLCEQIASQNFFIKLKAYIAGIAKVYDSSLFI